jgi:Holliday junction resolvase RusA-like endonuclease
MDAITDCPLPQKRKPVVVVELPGPPRGQGRPRSRIATKKGGDQFVAVYKDAESRSYEAMLRYAAQQAMAGRPPYEHPLNVRVTAFMPVPDSWSDRQKRLALQGARRPSGRPDADNILKAILDACNRIVWVDDARIVKLLIEKHYDERPRLRMEVFVTALGTML